MQFTLPSGARLRMRGMKVGNMLDTSRTKKSRSESDVVFGLLKECTVEVLPPVAEDGEPVPPNPYPNGLTDWLDAVACDIQVAVIAMRVATYPDQPYICSVRCPACRKMLPGERTTLNLQHASDDYVIPMPAESVAAFASGNRMPVRVGGHDLVIRFETGRAGLQLVDDSDLLARLQLRIVGIDGVEDPEQIKKMLPEFDLAFLGELQHRLEELDGGVMDVMEVICPCGWEGEAKIPFSGQNFLFPFSRARSDRMMARTRAARRRSRS